ncbi:MAG: hypothetical protein Q4C95_00510 [Planctomycetia bacterium]|nr:hypothetical protein [Planctomycetia bacterium]
MKHKNLFLLLTIAIVAFVGCGPNNTGLTGKVSFSDDHSPLTKGIVILDDGSHVAKGPIQPDGTFKMGFEKAGNGVPPGTYKVYIQGAVDVEPEEHEDQDGKMVSSTMLSDATFLIDKKFTTRKTTDIEVTVTKEDQVLDIVVDRPSK